MNRSQFGCYSVPYLSREEKGDKMSKIKSLQDSMLLAVKET